MHTNRGKRRAINHLQSLRLQDLLKRESIDHNPRFDKLGEHFWDQLSSGEDGFQVIRFEESHFGDDLPCPSRIRTRPPPTTTPAANDRNPNTDWNPLPPRHMKVGFYGKPILWSLHPNRFPYSAHL